MLYADHIELISPTALSIAIIAAGTARGVDFVFELFAGMDEETLRTYGFEGDITQVRALLPTVQKLYGMSRADRRRRIGPEKSRELMAMVNSTVDQVLHGKNGFETIASRMWEEAGAPDLGAAMEAGLLTLSTDAFDVQKDTKTQVEQYTATIERLIRDPRSHLMFDADIATLAASLQRERGTKMDPLAAKHTKQLATATGLIEHLPAFPDASVESILKTRRDLNEPLIRYRRGVVAVTQKLASAPLEPALSAEVSDLWRDEVQPTLVALRRDLSATRLVRDAALNLATDAKAVASGVAGIGLQFGIQTLEWVAQWSGLAVAAIAPLAVQAGATAIKETSARVEAAHTHDLYYLLEANKRLR